MEINHPSQPVQATATKPFTFEGYLVTDRLYDSYLEDFSLPEVALDNAGIVLDLGAGFASFVEEANKRHGNSGTHVIGLDIQYAKMANTGGDLETFEKNGGRFTPGYGKLERGAPDNERDIAYQAMYNEVTKTGNYVAGTYDKLPFADSSVDLLVAHNSILNPSRSMNNLAGLAELPRVVKPSGEIRLTPSYFAWNEEAGEVGLAYLEADAVVQNDTVSRSYQHTEVLKAFSSLEQQGAKFWLPTRKYDDVIESGALIIRFDDEVPVLDTPVGTQDQTEWYDDEQEAWREDTYTQGLSSFSVVATDKGFSVSTTPLEK